MRTIAGISWRELARIAIAFILAGVLIICWWGYSFFFAHASKTRLDVISPDGVARCEIVDVQEGPQVSTIVTVYSRQGRGDWQELRQVTLGGDSAYAGEMAVDWQLDENGRTHAVRVFEVAWGSEKLKNILNVPITP